MLITDTFSWDFSTFESYVEGMCQELKKNREKHIVFWGHSTPEAILTLFACWKIGKIACPLNIRLPSADPACLLLNAPLFTPHMPEDPPPSHNSDWDLDNVAVFLYTSGSSGPPKLACLSLKNLVLSAQGSNRLIPLSQGDRWGLTLPLFHVGGLGILMRCYLAKSFVLMTPNLTQATHLSLVPTQLYRLIQSQRSFSKLKAILLGGAPLPDLAIPWPIIKTYGMTEMSSQIITKDQLHPYAELMIDSQQQILVRGLILFQGYYQNSKIELPLNREGWFETGDLGCWEERKFKVWGRKDNLFISGGENIQPEEIEELICRYFDDQKAIVVPIPDNEFGSKPAVFLSYPQKLSEIQKLLTSLLPKYKIPTRAFPFPTQQGLKVDRGFLKKLALASKDFYS